ncbi:MAG TPA: gamma-glutamylcyclotransferase [Paenalcaligenes sp.]|nr:gamma-glutamylcyclotransferase [Paenalcaligenes sp.]
MYLQPPSAASFRRLSEHELNRSMHETLRQWHPQQPLWVFAYASLIWRPEFPTLAQRPATLHGYHRSLCLWSRINRGTPEQPGLVFALDRGGSCEGVVYQLPNDQIRDIFPRLWQREMPSGSYVPKWLNCETDQDQITALTFVMRRNCPAYAPQIPLVQQRDIISQAHGVNGACLDYVLETHRALEESGIHDPKLSRLVHYLNLHQLN